MQAEVDQAAAQVAAQQHVTDASLPSPVLAKAEDELVTARKRLAALQVRGRVSRRAAPGGALRLSSAAVLRQLWAACYPVITRVCLCLGCKSCGGHC